MRTSGIGATDHSMATGGFSGSSSSSVSRQIADWTSEDGVVAAEVGNRCRRRIGRNSRAGSMLLCWVEGIKEGESRCNMWRRDGEPGTGEESLGEENEILGYPG